MSQVSSRLDAGRRGGSSVLVGLCFWLAFRYLSSNSKCVCATAMALDLGLASTTAFGVRGIVAEAQHPASPSKNKAHVAEFPSLVYLR